MLFNSYAFLLCFLPAVLLVYQLVSRFHRRAVVIWLGVASLAFYGYWKPAFLLVLGTSILFNFLISVLISRTIPNGISTRLLMWTAIAVNLGALCWFKYLFPVLNFFSEHLHLGTHWNDVLLPLGISFFTFTQTAYLIDLQQGAAEQQDFFSYLLFVTFFPHVIAGPILHHKDIIPQFQRDRDYGLHFNDLAVGFTWFAMGLFKKAVIADKLAKTVTPVFAAHGAVRPVVAWIGVLTYVLQLYFDFSGYSDMANGLARMFSIDFPLNFASPFKAQSIIDFWQRWHMTLTQYIGSYLYSPVQFWVGRVTKKPGVSRSRQAATFTGFLQLILFPTVFTMFIAGIWHGAGQQFLVFGLLHGFYLTVNHGWRGIRQRRGIESPGGAAGVALRVGCVLLTFCCVILADLFFRAPSVREALLLLGRMLGVAAPASGAAAVEIGSLPLALAKIAGGLIIVWGFPNTQQILARYKPALRLAPTDEKRRWLPIFWEPSVGWGLAIGLVMMVALVQMQNPTPTRRLESRSAEWRLKQRKPGLRMSLRGLRSAWAGDFCCTAW
jgi:D-alanyl-lipoteichoic acid acyltransferase DltB (MBOAT superfamily)